MSEFNLGDIVRTPYGLPATVSGLFDESFGSNRIECTWWDGERFLRARFSPDEVTLIGEAATT